MARVGLLSAKPIGRGGAGGCAALMSGCEQLRRRARRRGRGGATIPVGV
jgi:hypothetical protein